MAFGHYQNEPLFLSTDSHQFIMGSSRSGKGVCLIIPHLLRYEGSAFVLDPKGENAKATGRHRATLNAQVHYLDPFGITGKPPSRFNPLAAMTPENMEEEANALATALVFGEGAQHDHWTDSAQQLLATFILYVYASPAIPPHRKDLPTMRRLLLSRTKEELTTMRDDPDHQALAGGLLSALAASFLATPPGEQGSIFSTAHRQTAILDNRPLAATLAAEGTTPAVTFADWHAHTMTVYLCLSAPRFPVFNRWLRLVLTAALNEMTTVLRPPPLPVSFVLDEIASLSHLQVIENAVGLAAGYGVQILSVWQDTAQMRELYKGRWASFINNAGVRAVFSINDYDSADYWSKFVGSRVIETTSHQRDMYGVDRGHSTGETLRPLWTSDELMLEFARTKSLAERPEVGRPPDEMLVLVEGARPFTAQRIPYFHDRTLDGLWDDPRV